MITKTKIFFAILISFLFSWTSPAQDDNVDLFVTTIPNAIVYPVPKDQFFGNFHRSEFNYVSIIKPKTLKEPEQAKVIDFANLHSSLKYDTYVVTIKGKRYYIFHDQVSDNSALDKKNNALLEEYDRLQEAVTDNELRHSNAYNSILKKIDEAITLNELRIKEIEENAEALEFEFVKDLAAKDIARARATYEKYRNWVKTLPKDVQPYADRLAIIDQSLEGDPNNPLNYSITFINWSAKTIKKLFWVGKAKNAFGEYVSCLAKNSSTFSNLYSGSVAPYTREHASWNGVLYNKEAHYMELTSVKIEYMDGTNIAIDSNSLKYITNLPNDILDNNSISIYSLYEGLSDEALKAPWVFEMSRIDFREQLMKEKENLLSSIDNWRKTKKIILEEGLWSSEVDHLGIGTINSLKYEYILPELREYGSSRRDRKALTDVLTKFRRQNLLEQE